LDTLCKQLHQAYTNMAGISWEAPFMRRSLFSKFQSVFWYQILQSWIDVKFLMIPKKVKSFDNNWDIDKMTPDREYKNTSCYLNILINFQELYLRLVSSFLSNISQITVGYCLSWRWNIHHQESVYSYSLPLFLCLSTYTQTHTQTHTHKHTHIYTHKGIGTFKIY
jgi:hypothetical protein